MDEPETSEQPGAEVGVHVKFDPTNLTWEDIEAVESAVVRSLLQQAVELADPDRMRPIPIPIPHAKFSKHSKSHTKRLAVAEDDPTPGTPVAPDASTEPVSSPYSGDVSAWEDVAYVEAASDDDGPLGARPRPPRPPRPFSRSYSKHTKFGT